jgi:hypothetical protein
MNSTASRLASTTALFAAAYELAWSKNGSTEGMVY